VTVLAAALRRARGRPPRPDPETGMLWTTPGAWRTDDGCYVADGRVWLYRRLDLAPLHLEDGPRRYEVAAPLQGILRELGDTARASPWGDAAALARSRPIHLLAVVWRDRPVPPASTTPALAAHLRAAYGDLAAPHKGLFVGVELWADAGAPTSLAGALRNAAAGLLGDDVPDLAPFQRDRSALEAIFARWGAHRLSDADQHRLESWYNDARGPDVTVVADRTRLLVDGGDVLELAALVDFERVRLEDPHDTWLADALAHPEGPVAVSVRAELQRPEVVRSRARRVQRRVRAQIEEQAKTDDLERAEDHDLGALAKEVEDHVLAGGEAMLTRCSVVLARRASDADRTYADELRSAYGIRVRPLAHRQLAALAETLPGSSARASRFGHDLSIPMIGHAGLAAWSDLGDDRGALLGLVLPDLVPCLLDTEAASRLSKPPAFVVVGEPGGGKTFTLQSIAHQAVLDGRRVVMINPKTDDDLSPMVELLRAEGGDAEVVFMSDLQQGSGAFDPWRFAKTPEAAAELAAQHITNVLPLDQERYVALKSGLVRGARAGARCTGEALASVADERLVAMVRDLAEGTPLFRLGIGWSPVSSGAVAGGGLTLVQFDQPLDLPDPATPRADLHPSERAAVAALRLVFRAATEMLLRPSATGATGGVLIVDEAWTFMASRDGLAALHRIGREGRSQRVLPILATQRLADVTTAELLSYVSRVLVLQMRDPSEARAALEVCGLEPTADRLAWLAAAGVVEPREGEAGRPPVGIMRDLHGRHAGVVLGPTPARHRRAWSTSSPSSASAGSGLA
jgi:hypothetical protein